MAKLMYTLAYYFVSLQLHCNITSISQAILIIVFKMNFVYLMHYP